MKRFLSYICIIAFSVSILSGCGQSASDTTATSTESGTAENTAAEAATEAAAKETQTEEDTAGEKLSVVSTIFPGYDFVREVAGEQVDVNMLLSPGAESHSYEPTPQDIIMIQNCDVFIYVGGESDEWVDRILETLDTSNMKIISMMDLVDVVEEETVEGMEEEEEHSHDTGDFEDSEVQDRELSDWAGDWQSVYPYLLDGTLDEVMEHKAEEDDEKTAEEYYEYYKTGYETDVERIVIDDNSLEFFKDGESSKAEYEYKGYEILTYESGSKGVRYLFEAVGETNGAPRYIQFSDHQIGPTEAEHFHLYWGDEGFDVLLEEMEHWPTYYPSELDAEGIVDEMLGHEEEEEFDEHVWTSPINAITITEAITDTLCSLDETNASVYQENSAAYVNELKDLDATFREIVENAQRKTLIVGDRFPFRYFVDEYGLEYYAAFPGCSTETEASAQTVAFLIDKTNEENIPVVFHIELSNEKMADTICESTGAKKMQLNSCHNVTQDQFDSGVGYLDLMKENAESLKEALS